MQPLFFCQFVALFIAFEVLFFPIFWTILGNFLFFSCFFFFFFFLFLFFFFLAKAKCSGGGQKLFRQNVFANFLELQFSGPFCLNFWTPWLPQKCLSSKHVERDWKMLTLSGGTYPKMTQKSSGDQIWRVPLLCADLPATGETFWTGTVSEPSSAKKGHADKSLQSPPTPQPPISSRHPHLIQRSERPNDTARWQIERAKAEAAHTQQQKTDPLNSLLLLSSSSINSPSFYWFRGTKLEES